MMSGRCLRSTPESTPIKKDESCTVEVGKGKVNSLFVGHSK